MSPTLHKIGLTLALALVAGTGCQPTQPFYFGEDGDLSHYVGVATEIDYPAVSEPTLSDAQYASAPLTLENANFDEFWEIPLADAIKITLANSKVLRSLGGRVDTMSGISQPSEALLANPDALQTIYNPAIQESAPGYINGLMTGPEAALSAFDATFSSSLFWEAFEDPINVNPAEARTLELALVNVQDIVTFQSQIQKTNVAGGTSTLSTTTTYDANNNERVLYHNSYRTDIKGEFRQPLLQGMGAEYNRIAGPFSNMMGIGTRMFDGVLIARIQTDRAITEFEAGVRNLVADVENTYWELYYAYRNLEARKVGLTSSLRTWQTVQAITRAGSIGGGKEREALAREQYFSFRAQTEQAKSDVFAAENRLRFLMGIAATDGRLIRPSDDPTMAKVTFDWSDILGESLARNVELRKQQWRIKQRELEVIAAKNHLLPRLDMVGSYRWLGFGHDLLGNGGPGPYPSAWNILFGGDFTESQLGVEMAMNLGFRAELSAVRNAQLLLTRSKAVLKEQELELSHLLADSVRLLARHYRLIETNFNRRVAAQAQVDTFQAKIDVGFGRNIEQLDLLLEAQRRLAEAEAEYFRSLVDYNKAIIQIQFHKGSLLEDNNVLLAEGPWPGKAYFDATRDARQLDASIFLSDLPSVPPAVSSGPYQQFTDHDTQPFPQEPAVLEPEILEEVPTEPELILPAPEHPRPLQRKEPKPLQFSRVPTAVSTTIPSQDASVHSDTLSAKIANAVAAGPSSDRPVKIKPSEANDSSLVMRASATENRDKKVFAGVIASQVKTDAAVKTAPESQSRRVVPSSISGNRAVKTPPVGAAPTRRKVDFRR
ncbi:MAG: TolC family protein [Pirellulales bacterium]|nr:TolC family protein [Pirellulales bacterium]